MKQPIVKTIRQQVGDDFWMKSANIEGFNQMIKIDEFTSIGLGINKKYPNLTSIVKKTIGAFMETEKYSINKKSGKATKILVRTELGVIGKIMYTSTKMDCLKKIQLDFSPFRGISIGDIEGTQSMTEFYKKHGIDSVHVESVGSKTKRGRVTNGYMIVRSSTNKNFYMLIVVSERDDYLFSNGNRYSIKCIYKGTKKMCLHKLGMV